MNRFLKLFYHISMKQCENTIGVEAGGGAVVIELGNSDVKFRQIYETEPQTAFSMCIKSMKVKIRSKIFWQRGGVTYVKKVLIVRQKILANWGKNVT